MDLGLYERKTMELLKMPLSDQEEAIVSLMQKINKLEHENRELKEELRMLKWSIMEHD
jgi:hypothetical protein